MDTATRTLLARSAVEVAPLLLGWTFGTTVNGVTTAVRLTEVEAYMGRDDPASHAYRGMTPRTAPMFETGGVIYVYFIYGVHHCVNVVTGPSGVAQAVLLRAGVPVEGEGAMVQRRGRSDHLTDGPGKLGQALGLAVQHSGAPIDGTTIALEPGPSPPSIAATPRIGITRAVDRRWRFVAGN